VQEIWIQYVQWSRGRGEDGLSEAFEKTLYGHRHALEAMVDHFGTNVVDLIQHVDETDVARDPPVRFYRILPVLLRHGWSPKCTPRWLRQLLTGLVKDGYHDEPWKEFVKIILAFFHHGVVLEDAEAPLMKDVIKYQISYPPRNSWGDYDVQKVIAKLLQANVKVTKADVAMAVEGNLFSVVGALAEKVSA
jgi:hypothetical protein